jgi:hypothetical protein
MLVSDIEGLAGKDFFPRQKRAEMREEGRNNKKEGSSFSVFSAV